LAPTAERITQTGSTSSETITVNGQTIVIEPFGTVGCDATGTYGVTRKTFVGALAPTTVSGPFANTIIASGEEETALGRRGHEEGDQTSQKEKSS